MEELAKIRDDPEAFLAGLEDQEGKGPPVTLPDGYLHERFTRPVQFGSTPGLRYRVQLR